MSNYQSEQEVFKTTADFVVNEMWNRMRPFLEEAFIKKIVQAASSGFMYSWERADMINEIINEEVKKQLDTTFRPIISQIAKEKARKIVEGRAKQCKIKLDAFKELESNE